MAAITVMVMVRVMDSVTVRGTVMAMAVVMVRGRAMVTTAVRVTITVAVAMSQEIVDEIIKTFERTHPLTRPSRKLEDRHPEKFAAALALRKKGYTIPVIARGLNISPDALQKALLRARSE